MTIRVLVVDDHGVLRAGLRALLAIESDMEVVGDAADAGTAFDMAMQTAPEVVLMDISLPGGGIEVTRSIVQARPETKVLILTVHEDTGLLKAAIDAGAAGYIIKQAVSSELINAIRAVARGDLYVHPALTRALLSNGGLLRPADTAIEEAPGAATAPDAETLSPREEDVLRLLAQGYTNREIADKLNLSVRTVESHRANLMAKLGLHTRADLVRFASQRGYLDVNQLGSD